MFGDECSYPLSATPSRFPEPLTRTFSHVGCKFDIRHGSSLRNQLVDDDLRCLFRTELSRVDTDLRAFGFFIGAADPGEVG